MDGGTSSGITEFTTISTQDNESFDAFSTDPLTTILVIGDIYNFRVIAVNIVGESIASGTFGVMAAVRPDAPTTLTRKTATTDSITI